MVWGIFKSPSFQDFVTASQQLNPFDALVLKEGFLEKKSPFEENEKALNARTWQAFSRALNGEFTSKHLKAITVRYGFDLDEMERSNIPLKRRFVEYFGVGLASPYTFNLREQQGYFAGNLEDLSPQEVHTLVKEATRNSYLGPVEDPTKITGGVRHAHEQLISDDFHTDQARSNLFRGISELVSKDPKIPRNHPYFSRLVMGIISLLETDPDNATLEVVIPAPADRDGHVDYYRVHKIVSNSGLNAIALVPISNESKLEPLLCFRCTKQTLGHHGTIDSNFENFNEHIGKAGYEACRQQLEQIADDPKFNRGKKFTVLCYSQGGAHASYFMRDNWRKVRQFVGFNSVGSDDQVVDILANEINALGEHDVPPAIYQHRNVSNPEGTKGDWVNRLGRKHLGHGIHHKNAITCVYEWLIHDHPTPSNNIWDPVQLGNWFNLHAVRPMDTDREDQPKSRWDKKWKYDYKLHMGPTQVDAILDTYKRDSTLEDLRHNIGYKIVYNIATEIASWVDFLVRLFNIDFFKR